jgi:hypothetical protein
MGLYDRLLGLESPRIPMHDFIGAMGELERGKITTQQAIDLFTLSAGEQTEATTLLAKIVPPRECITFGGRITLTNIGTTFLTLGAALVQTAGITEVIFGVRVQKIGNGTQSWRLFNDTDVSQIAIIDDTAAAGSEKNLSTTVSFSPALGAGIKTILVQAKSTTAADDPVYFGGAASIRRVSVLTALELHEVLLMAQSSTSPYHDVTALKTRLGV